LRCLSLYDIPCPSAPRRHSRHRGKGAGPGSEASGSASIALDPNSYDAHYFYARSNFAQGKIEEAVRHFERAGEIKPDDYQIPCLLIGAYKSLGRERDAQVAAGKGVELAERELALHPEDSRPAQLGAGALFELGDKVRAREWTARVLAIDPDDPVAQYNSACSFSRLGEVNTALDLLERCLPNLGHEKVNWSKYDAELEAARRDQRYTKILEQLGQA
jgi:adenylate cyclase